MPRDATLHVTPLLHVDRAALAGAVIAAAGEQGLSLADLPRGRTGAGCNGVELAVASVVLLPADRGAPLGITALDGRVAYSFGHAANDACVVRATGAGMAPTELANAAHRLGVAIFRQLVLREVVTALRDRGFAIVERLTSTDGAVTLRARLPLVHQLRPTARTARPEFSVQVAARGAVTVGMVGLHRDGRGLVEELFGEILGNRVPLTAPTTLPVEAALRRQGARVHAA